MMDIIEFSKLLEEEFEDMDTGTLSPTTNYRDLPDFSSMHALIIIAFIDNEFDVLLKGEDLRKTNTVQDLYDTIISRLT